MDDEGALDPLRRIADAIPTLLSYVDRDLVYRYHNRAYLDWFGHADVTGRSVREVVGEAAFAAIAPRAQRALAGETVEFEADIVFPQNVPRRVHARYVPDIGPDGEARGFIVCVADITRRAKAEEALRAAGAELERRVAHRTRELAESRERARRFSNLSLDLMAILDDGGRFVEVNPAATQILGWSADEIASRPLLDFVHPDDVDAALAEFAAIAAAGKISRAFEARIACRDGSHRWLEWAAQRAPDGLIYAVARDVSERKRVEGETMRHMVAKRVARRILAELTRQSADCAKREIGRAIGREAGGEKLLDHLDAFESMGLGIVRLTAKEGDRYTFQATEVFDRQPGGRAPSCQLMLGCLEGALGAATGRECLGNEMTCQSQGHAACTFLVHARPPDARRLVPDAARAPHRPRPRTLNTRSPIGE